MIGQISSRDLTLEPGKHGRPSRITTGTWKRPWRACRSLPSYISSTSFSAAIIDLLVPNAAGQTTMAQVQDGIDALPEWMPTLKQSLQTLAANAGEDIDLFRTSVENWYDDQKQLSDAAQAGLPIGWGTVPDCAAPKTSCNWLDQRGIFSRHGGSGWEIVLRRAVPER